jgi:hypothetical protein
MISNSDCASVSVVMENTANLEGEFCKENLDPLYSGQPLPLFCQVYAYIPNARGTPEPYLEYIVPSMIFWFHIELIQDPYVTPSDVSSQARIVLPATCAAGCSGFGSCDMHGGAGETTTPAEDPWFRVRPAPSKCANLDDGSYIVTIQGYLPEPPPPPPPTP